MSTPTPIPTTKTSSSPTAGRKAPPRSARRRSREFALQGLYEWLVNRGDVAGVDAHMREQDGFARCDAMHFETLLHGCVRDAAALDVLLSKHLDRPFNALSPVEHGTLFIGTYELMHCPEVPYKVAINEAVEMTKSFGGTDGHKYVNGVLDKMAFDLRPAEVIARRGGAPTID